MHIHYRRARGASLYGARPAMLLACLLFVYRALMRALLHGESEARASPRVRIFGIGACERVVARFCVDVRVPCMSEYFCVSCVTEFVTDKAEPVNLAHRRTLVTITSPRNACY